MTVPTVNQSIKKVSTIIVCMGNVNETRQCIQSVIQDGFKENHILVIENGTTDNLNTLSNEFKQATFLSLSENCGFAGGVNHGLREAKKRWDPDYFFLLNNDATVKEGALFKLVQVMEENSSYGLVAPKILESKRILWSAGGAFNSKRFMAKNRGEGEIDQGQFDDLNHCAFLSGCALMIRKEVVESVGLLDEQFFTYSEDLDYCLRATKNGWILFYEPKAEIFHAGSATAGGEYEPFQSFYRWRNRLLIIHKHADLLKKIFFYFIFAPLLITRDTLNYLMKRKVWSIPYLYAGLFQFLSISLLNQKVKPLNRIVKNGK